MDDPRKARPGSAGWTEDASEEAYPERHLVPIKGRGVSSNPPNRFEKVASLPDSFLDEEGRGPETEYLRDASRTIISRNNSPDIGFDASLNPYRGCQHGCVYCYARPWHEYLGFSAGLDFETKILVKERAPELLRDELAAPRWKPQVLVMSGVTDPYQPVERKLEITRGCLEVLAEFRNPVGIITKNHMVTRDADLLQELASHRAARVTLSITTLRNELQRVMEPRTAIPARRLAAVEALARAGIPVGVNVAPVIPGLTDHELPEILRAAADAGATRAAFMIVRLPHSVASLFERWLGDHFPGRKEKVLNRLRAMRKGRLNDPRFGKRFRGEGPFMDQIGRLFEMTCRKLGLNGDQRPLSAAAFRRPAAEGQTELFG